MSFSDDKIESIVVDYCLEQMEQWFYFGSKNRTNHMDEEYIWR